MYKCDYNSEGFVVSFVNNKSIEGSDNMPRMIVIPPRTDNAVKKLRVAAYCRVSTNHADQENSYETQVRYFSELFDNSSTHQLVGIYTPDMVVKRKENDILMRCHIKPLDYDRIRKEIFELVSEKYDRCSYDRTNARTREIKSILSATGQNELPGINEIRKILHKVTADHMANIKAEFINGKAIELRKEH